MAITQAEKPIAGAIHPPQVYTKKRITSKKLKDWAGKLVVYILLTAGAIIFIAPWAWMVSASFQPIGKIFDWPPNWIPETFTINNYVRFLKAEGFFRWVLN